MSYDKSGALNDCNCPACGDKRVQFAKDERDRRERAVASREVEKELETRVGRLETKVWGLPPDVTIGQLESEITPKESESRRVKVLQAKVKRLIDNCDAAKGTASVVRQANKSQGQKIHRLQQVVDQQQDTIRIQGVTVQEQQVSIERKSSTNRNASKLLDKKDQEITALDNEISLFEEGEAAFITRIESLKAVMRDAIQMIVSSFHSTDTTRKLSALLRSIL